MYGMFTYIYHKDQLNVGKSMGYINISLQDGLQLPTELFGLYLFV